MLSILVEFCGVSKRQPVDEAERIRGGACGKGISSI